MLSLFKTSLLIILTVQFQYADGNQRIVHVSELVSDHEDFIASGEDDNSLICCVYGNCSCSSLDHALANLTSNVLINITTDVTLSSLVTLSDLENVSIIGHNNPTVNCRNAGGIHFTFCNNCIFQGIAWDGCGTENGAGLMLTDSYNITISNCSFQHSKGQAVLLSEVSGDVNINHCNFLQNNYYRGHGAAIHYLSSNGVSTHNKISVFTISDSNFVYNYAKSLVYIETTVTKHDKNINFLSVKFCDNHGISVYAVNHNLYLNGNISFQNNTAGNGAGIYISDHSTVIFGENSDVAFTQNSAKHRGSGAGGAIFLTDHSNVIFDNNSMATFSDNEATYGGAIYCEVSSNITFKSTYKVTFNHNTARLGGAVFSYSNSRVTFDGNSTASFNSNIANVYGGAIASYDKSLISFAGNSSPIFNNNAVDFYGSAGAIYSSYHCYIFFKGNSSPMFNNNFGSMHGGAIHSDYYSYMFFEESSSPGFSDNSALDGGAIYSYYNVSILFKGNSTAVFRNNIGFINGGAIHSAHNSYIGFEGNTSPVFSNNVITAANSGAISFNNHGNEYVLNFDGPPFSNNTDLGGGAIYCNDSNIVFTENASPVFSDNICSYKGGAISFCNNNRISFKGNSSAVFDNNTATIYGGALFFSMDSTIAFEDNSNVVLSNNIAEFGGAVFAKDHSDIIFSDNSTITFTNNSPATVSSNKIITTGNPTVIFNGQSARWCNSTCLPYTRQGITINSNGIVWCNDPESFICISKKCHCNQLEVLLDDLKNNTLVKIPNTVTLSSVIKLVHLNNISIIGYNNVAVICNDTGGLDLLQCIDITIEGITWIGCGYYDSTQPKSIPVLSLQYFNIVIQKCAFQYSLGIAILLYNIQNDVYINHCNFTNNNFYYLHGTAIYCSVNHPVGDHKLNINNCIFRYNINAQSIVYFNIDYKYFNNINLSTSSFQNNQGVSVYLSKRIVLHISGEVLFENNVAENGAGIYISDKSTVVFDESSNAKFINNSVNHNGAAIFLNHHSDVIFDQNSIVTFTDNKAANGIVYCEASSNVTFKGTSKVTFSSNSAIQYGAAIYSSDNSLVTFTGNSKVTFSNNVVSSNDIYLQHSGTIYSENNGYVSFEDNSFTLFTNNTANYGAAIYSFSDSHVVFKDNSTVTFNNNVVLYCGALTSLLHSSIIYEDNTKVSYNANKVSCTSTSNNEPSAAAMCTFQGTIVYSGHSLVMYTSNKAGGGGAVVLSDSNVIVEEYSAVTFKNNFSKYSSGGAFVCYNNSNVTIKDNSNVTFNSNKASQDGGAIYSYNMCSITFKDNSTSSFIYNTASNNGGAILSSQLNFLGNSTVTFDENTANNGGAFYSTNSNITVNETSRVSFYNNKAIRNGGTGYLNSHCVFLLEQNVKVMFDNNKAFSGGALCIDMMTKFIVQGNSTALFYNNLAIAGGGALKVLNDSRITLQDYISIKFVNNTAQYGGAVFLDTTGVMINNSDNNCMDFTNNFAKMLGNSVYQDASEFCASSNDSCFNRTMGINYEFVDTPPIKLKFNDPAICIDNGSTQQCNSYFITNIMLGKSILMPACVLNYYNQSVDSLQFLVQSDANLNYHISGPKQVVISCNDTFEAISIIGNQSLSSSINFTITITLNTALYSDWKQISMNMIIGLSPCHPGFWQYPNSIGCECYNDSNIVFCSGNSSTIKRGYWFGNVTDKPTVTFCPINYCNFTCCEASNGYYHLSPVRVNQCRSHRSGTACGNCEEGYTLSFDSVQCINVTECSTGKTILVFSLIMLYWIAIITSVFSMMHFKIGIGYLYAITYYYSVVDLLLNQNLYLSSTLNTTINIMSSIAKITPQFLGKLCLITNMSGIDQQFIHYIHPIAVSVFLVMITVLARRSRRLSHFISKGIIHVICCLLLLSYTSLATTSLLLMRPLIFHDVDKVYAYVSPDIEYFHGRHLAYAIVALLFTIVIVIGLPLLLAFEPFLNSKINFIKIKPLLDQFQSCYKDKYRCFAAYYMICRLVIITIIIANSSNDFVFQYLLITACVAMALIHHSLRPYSSSLLNVFDGVILHFLVLVSVSPLVESLDSVNSNLLVGITFILVILPLLTFITMSLMINKEKIKRLPEYCYTKCVQLRIRLKKYLEIPLDEPEESSDEEEFVNVIDDSRRVNATICDV